MRGGNTEMGPLSDACASPEDEVRHSGQLSLPPRSCCVLCQRRTQGPQKQWPQRSAVGSVSGSAKQIGHEIASIA
jgi:hypothetical protein